MSRGQGRRGRRRVMKKDSARGGVPVGVPGGTWFCRSWFCLCSSCTWMVRSFRCASSQEIFSCRSGSKGGSEGWERVPEDQAGGATANPPLQAHPTPVNVTGDLVGSLFWDVTQRDIRVAVGCNSIPRDTRGRTRHPSPCPKLPPSIPQVSAHGQTHSIT